MTAACRFCAGTTGELRRVPLDPDGTALVGMTRTRRATLARIDRLRPVVEHAECLAAAEADQARRRDLTLALRRHAIAAMRAGDEATGLALLDAVDDANTLTELDELAATNLPTS